MLLTTLNQITPLSIACTCYLEDPRHPVTSTFFMTVCHNMAIWTHCEKGYIVTFYYLCGTMGVALVYQPTVSSSNTAGTFFFMNSGKI